MKEYIVVLKVKTQANIVHVAQVINNAAEHHMQIAGMNFAATIENIGLQGYRYDNEDI